MTLKDKSILFRPNMAFLWSCSCFASKWFCIILGPPHKSKPGESSSFQPFHLCCQRREFNSLLISQFESHLARRQSQIITNNRCSSAGEQKEIIFQILLRGILEFYWRQVLRRGFTSLASVLFGINSSWSEIRSWYPNCQLIRVLPRRLLLACFSGSRSRDAAVHNNKLKSSPKFLLKHL